jgi:uncharacterized protein DUF6220
MASLLQVPTQAPKETIPADVMPAIERRGPRPRMARAHLWTARALLGALSLQLFFAGLGVFGVTSFLPHATLGALIILTSLALPIIAWRGRLGRSTLRTSWALFGLMALQGLLIDVGRIVHIVSALHPVNAMLLVLVTYSLARRNS